MFFTPSIIADFFLLGIVGAITIHALTLGLRRRFVVFDPLNMFWAGAVVIYFYQPIAFSDQLIEWYGQGVLEVTLFWVLVGLSLVVIGYEGKWGAKWGKHIPTLPRQLSGGGLFGASLSLIGLGFAGYAVEFSSAGGIEKWASVARGGTDWETISSYWGILTSLLPAGVGLLVLHVEMHRTGLLRRFLAWTLLALMLLWFFYLGTRSRTIMLAMMALMAYYLPRRKNPPTFLLAAVFLSLFVTSNFLAHYRDQFTNLSFNFDKTNWDEAIALSLPGIAPATPVNNTRIVSKGVEFSCTMAVFKLVPNQVPFNYGYSEVEFLTRMVPRNIWPNKRYPHYEAFTPIYYMEDLSRTWVSYAATPVLMGPAFGYIGHWYAVGGPLALVVAGLFTGGFFRALRTIYDRPEKREGDLVLYALVIVPIGFGEAAATPLFWLFTLPLILFPMVVLVYLTRRREKRARHSQKLRKTL